MNGIVLFNLVSNVLVILMAAYVFVVGIYQNRVAKIFANWVKNRDKRMWKYDLNTMYFISKHNWFGLKWPKDSDFK